MGNPLAPHGRVNTIADLTQAMLEDRITEFTVVRRMRRGGPTLEFRMTLRLPDEGKLAKVVELTDECLIYSEGQAERQIELAIVELGRKARDEHGYDLGE